MCFNPKFAYFNYEISKTKNQKRPTLNKNIIFIKKAEDEINALNKNVIVIPCGKCLACRINQANNWATRCYLESKKYKDNFFLTLTIDSNKEIVKEEKSDQTLNKKVYQKFMKSLRKYVYEKTGRYIRFFGVGEYGNFPGMRPHYHIGVFNLPKFKDMKFWKYSKTGVEVYVSDILNNIWKRGYCYIEYMNFEAAAYIARYTQKKINRNLDNWCKANNKELEFKTTSRKPGLALDITKNEKEFEKIKSNFGILVKHKDGKVKLKGIPQALRKKWRDIDRIEYFEKSDEHTEQIKNNLKKILEKTNLTPRQYRIQTAKKTEENLRRLVRDQI